MSPGDASAPADGVVVAADAVTCDRSSMKLSSSSGPSPDSSEEASSSPDTLKTDYKEKFRDLGEVLLSINLQSLGSSFSTRYQRAARLGSTRIMAPESEVIRLTKFGLSSALKMLRTCREPFFL